MKSRGERGARRCALLLLMWAAVSTSWRPLMARAELGDFWAEVRTPGLRAYRAQIAEGQLAMRNHQPERCLEFADQAIAALPEEPDAHVLRMIALDELGRDAPAFAALVRVRALAPALLETSAAALIATRVAMRNNELKIAAEIAEAAVARMTPSPLRAELYAMRGNSLLALGPEHLRTATLSFREAIRFGNDPGPRLGLALALRRAGELIEAEGVLRDAGNLRQRFEASLRALSLPAPEISARRALALMSLGDFEAARAAWTLALASPHWRSHAAAELARPLPRNAPRPPPPRPRRGAP